MYVCMCVCHSYTHMRWPMVMCAIVRLSSYLVSTDVQLYNRVSCDEYITRFKEVCSKRNNFREQLAFV